MEKTLHVKILYDRYGTREFVIFRSGEFAKPIAILTEMYAENFLNEFQKAVEAPDMKVREIIINKKETK
jgi:hypothetical protein